MHQASANSISPSLSPRELDVREQSCLSQRCVSRAPHLYMHTRTYVCTYVPIYMFYVRRALSLCSQNLTRTLTCSLPSWPVRSDLAGRQAGGQVGGQAGGQAGGLAVVLAPPAQAHPLGEAKMSTNPPPLPPYRYLASRTEPLQCRPRRNAYLPSYLGTNAA